ncbi:putative apyrase [Medicago truncatula]|uniref:Putative apyrase n=1 Tax=Medicago truncatula TaxID=3880 RepID=A0A396H3X7_MEDTR|nr:putative apyrase [Medicago truncatula]
MSVLENVVVELGNTLSVALGDIGGGITIDAVSREQAKKAPQVPQGEDPYIKKIVLKGKKYYLYVHRFYSYSWI